MSSFLLIARRLLLGSALLLLLFCLLLIGFVYYRETHLPAVLPSDVIIVLGAQVLPEGTPSVALTRRLNLAAESYAENPQLIICCGAQGANEPAAEGDVMKAYLIEHGIPESGIVAETSSFNTRQNLLNAKEIMEERGLSQALVITSDYHVSRALALCKRLGISATGKGSPSKPEYFIKNHLREGLSWIKFFVEGFMA